jgi:hypothetical protein
MFRSRSLRWERLWLGAAALAVCGCGEAGSRQATGAAGAPPTTPETGSPIETMTCGAAPLVPQRLWRLSNAQYGNAVRDLLGLAQAPSVTGGGQSAFSFYSADTETVSDALAFSYSAAAEAAAQAADVEALAACASGEAQEACAVRFIATLLPRAFRRPAGEVELAELLAVYRAGAAEGHAGALRLVVEAVLNAPSFVYRRELGTPIDAERAELTPHEIAAELSFLLLDSLPDAGLLAAADSGALSTAAGVQQELERLLTLPRVQENLTRVVVDWFGAPQVQSKSKHDPGFDEALKSDLVSESRQFVHDNLWSGSGTLNGLITSGRTFLNQRLAAFYGVQAAGATETQFVPFDFNDGQRAGILTQASIMATHADVEQTSVVLRGRFVRAEVLCLQPLPPPPAIASDPAIVAALAAAQTERARAEYRASNPVCQACHAGLDPLGLPFERFDAMGRYRSQLLGAPVDASAELAPTSLGGNPALSGRVDGAAELAARAQGDAFLGCAVQKLTSYALGRPIQRWGGDDAACALDGVQKAVPAERVSIPEVVRSISLSPLFRTRRIAGGA